MEQGDELLPGIPNELTVNLIAPKLPWTTFYVLSQVSHGWQRTIKSHQVYDARVRSNSTQTLIALDGEFDNGSTVALYSLEDGSCYQLPRIPYIKGRMSASCECAFLDGKLYAMGGTKDWGVSLRDSGITYSALYVLDLAGQRRWEKCASMKNRRSDFGCGVKDGNIYVFGGSSGSRPVCGSEVYDPKEDAWSPITSSPFDRIDHKVTMMGEELFLHSGMFYAQMKMNYDNGRAGPWRACFAEVYHPLKNEWRIVENFTRTQQDIVVTVGGKFYRLNLYGIQVYDMYANSWGPSQPISFGVVSERSNFCMTAVIAAVGVDDEVLAMVQWTTEDSEDEEHEEEEDIFRRLPICLIKSRGVAGKSTEITWQILHSPMFLDVYASFMCPIKL